MIDRIIKSATSSFTPVSVLDANIFGLLFSSASPVRVSTTEAKQVTKFQVETGETKNDHVIDLPVEISIDFIIVGNGARVQFASLQQKFSDKELVLIQTRMTSYENMLIESISNDEMADISDGSMMTVRFIEWREIQPEYGELSEEKVSNPKHTNTVSRGRQSGSDVTQKQKGSWLDEKTKRFREAKWK